MLILSKFLILPIALVMLASGDNVNADTRQIKSIEQRSSERFDFTCGENIITEYPTISIIWTNSSGQIEHFKFVKSGKIDETSQSIRIRNQIILSQGSPGFYAFCTRFRNGDIKGASGSLMLRTRGGVQPWEEIVEY